MLLAISHGIHIPLHCSPLLHGPRNTAVSRETSACISEGLETGALERLPPTTANRTTLWTSVFALRKPSWRHRLITDLGALNTCSHTSKFKAQKWTDVLDVLQDLNIQWVITINLQAYFHKLGIQHRSRRFLRIRTPTECV